MATEPGVTFHPPSAGGKTGALIREKDWATTRLGPRRSWPKSLENHLAMILELPTAAIIFWGPDRVQLYNDGYSVIMGPRHPKHLGSTFKECWPEAYDGIHPWMVAVVDKGEVVEVNRTLVPLTRFGFTEEAYFTFTFTALRDDEGRNAGVLQLVTEVTGAVLGERRAALARELSGRTAEAKSTADATRLAAEVLEKHGDDVPFSLLYVADPTDRDRLVLDRVSGLDAKRHPFPQVIDARGSATAPAEELARAVRERKMAILEVLVGTEAPSRVFAAPIVAGDGSVAAFIVGGTSPRLQLDAHYRGFLELLASQLSRLFTAVRAEEAIAALRQRRTEELEATVETQKEAILELSTPVLKVRDGLLLLPLVGAMDPRRARHLTESMLRSIRDTRARVAVMDITGVPIVDSKVANHLAQACESARLMGAEVIVTGVSASIAEALVAIGADLGAVRTIGDLQAGLEEAARVLKTPLGVRAA